jgi:hypothetical protein
MTPRHLPESCNVETPANRDKVTKSIINGDIAKIPKRLLLTEEFSAYETLRRTDIYQIETYNEFSYQTLQIIETQMALCLATEMDSICDKNHEETHDFPN